MRLLQRSRGTEAGFSLVELMISMVIALVLTLVISKVMIDHEGAKRTTTTLNDANQNGLLASYELDRSIRSSGSGFVQSATAAGGNALGCRLNVRRSNQAILPRPSPFPAPFAAMDVNMRLAPVLITRGTTSDVLTVMSGSAGFGEVGRAVLAMTVQGTPSVRMVNNLGWKPDDVFLLVEDGRDCMMQQTGALPAGSSDTMTLGGTYFSATGSTVSLADYGAVPTFAVALGNISTNTARHNPPEFKLYGVDPARNTLVSYDPLQQGVDDAPLPLADGVVVVRALYGVDLNGDGVWDRWEQPTGTYASTALMNGTGAAQTLLRQIVSVRLALVMQTSQPEKEVQGTSVNLFEDIGQTLTETFTGDATRTRHRIVEITIPLRNVLLL